MRPDPAPKSGLIKRIVLHSAKWPLVYFLLGCVLIALSNIDHIFAVTEWQNIFDLTNKLGHVFIALAAITFIYNLFIFFCLRSEQKLSHTHTIIAVILASIRKSSRIIFILVAINIIISIATPPDSYQIFANNFINTIIIASIGWITIHIFYTIEAVLYQYMLTLTNDEHIRINALYTKMRIIRNIASVVIVIITVAAILMSFDSVKNIGISLLASAGFLTAIIGLSAQKTLFSLFSGLQIALAQPIKIGDIVVIEKESGIVEEITFTYVTLKLGDKRRLVVPITFFIEKPFENWSREGNSLRNSIMLYVDYMMPIDPLRAELDNILTHSPYWDGVAKKLQVSNLNDHAVEVRIQVSAANADDLSGLKAEVREQMLGFIREKYPDYFPKARALYKNLN